VSPPPYTTCRRTDAQKDLCLIHEPCLDNLDALQVFASGDALLKSPLWQQILADAFGVRIHVLSGEKQAAAKGAAILAVRHLSTHTHTHTRSWCR
jgi:sugar (pentulose or hexulose) kinase